MVAVYAPFKAPHVDIIVVGADDQGIFILGTRMDLSYGRDRFEVRHGDIGDQALDGLLSKPKKLRPFSASKITFTSGISSIILRNPGSYNSMIIGQQDTSILHKIFYTRILLTCTTSIAGAIAS